VFSAAPGKRIFGSPLSFFYLRFYPHFSAPSTNSFGTSKFIKVERIEFIVSKIKQFPAGILVYFWHMLALLVPQSQPWSPAAVTKVPKMESINPGR
jgi:hypothetical protein